MTLADALLAELDDAALTTLAERLRPYLDEAEPTCDEMTVDEAARAAGLSSRTVRRALHAGTLAGHQLAGRWRVTSDDLERWRAAGAPTSARLAVGTGRGGRPARGDDGAAAILGEPVARDRGQA